MANSYLNRTQGSATNQKKGTFSFWIKRSALGSNQRIVTNYNDSNNLAYLRFNSSDQLQHYVLSGGSAIGSIISTRVFRDVSAWYHIVMAIDTTQATAADRIKFYVNGVQETSFGTNTIPSQNADHPIFASGTHYIGRHSNDADYFSGYISHAAQVDGTALTPTSFGETNTATDIWKFKTPTGITWGNNGYHLKFENSGNLGLDSSGNTNNFTKNGNLIQSIDTPSNTHCTLNPNDVVKQSGGIYKPTFSNANLTMSATTNHNYQTFGTISPETGKWYWEFKVDTATTTGHRLGIFFANDKTHGGSYYYGTDAFYIHQNGEIYYNGSSTTYMSSYTAGDIISVALDITNGHIYFSKNGGASDSTWADGSGNNNQAFPGTSVNTKLSVSWPAAGTPITPFFDVYGNGNKQSINFGNGYFGTTAITSAGSNGNGSLFEYDVPTGYYALNSKNLNTYG
tara:strand:- start:1024 stop:2388 length:1365 start_codon:yes stop_codon:yes gene_type:complete